MILFLAMLVSSSDSEQSEKYEYIIWLSGMIELRFGTDLDNARQAYQRLVSMAQIGLMPGVGSISLESYCEGDPVRGEVLGEWLQI